jgi:hypothetical protein
MWRLTLVVLAAVSLIDRVHAAEPPLEQKDATVVINGQREVLEKQLFEFPNRGSVCARWAHKPG